MSDVKQPEPAKGLCESCGINPAGEIGTCPYLEAKYVCGPVELRDRLCNCCDECAAECKERS
jgi:hypothetical protein